MGAALLITLGVWLFLQIIGGRLVERIASFTDESAAFDESQFFSGSSSSGKKRYPGNPLTVRARRGAQFVLDRAKVAAANAGGGFVVISWYRPGAVAPSGEPSYHARCLAGARAKFGARRCGLALDIQPKPVNGKIPWQRLDDLYDELARMNPKELIWRGDPDHDVALGAKVPHVHVAWEK